MGGKGWLVWLVLACGCGFEGGAPGDKGAETRVTRYEGAVVISESDPNFRRFELPESEGECESDEACSPAGCSAEVCTTAKQAWETMTTCDATHPGEEFYCGCLAARCRWQKL